MAESRETVAGAARRMRPFAVLWEPPTGVLLDVSAGGEVLTARIRLAMIALLFVIPLLGMIGGDPWTDTVVGFTIAAVAAMIGLLLLWGVSREVKKRWIPFATSAIDVSIVSAALLYFAISGQPAVAVNSKILYEVYFLAIAMTCLRYDMRVTALAGGLAMVEYVGVVWWTGAHYDLHGPLVTHAVYGTFSWYTQVSREILLFIATMLGVANVGRARKLHELSTSDSLTGLHNRGYFDERFREEVFRAKRHHRVLSVAMLDVDRFKGFNDTWGHSAGDIALKEVARAIRKALRQTDVVARYGGEEIVIILPETPPESAVRKLEHIRRLVADMPVPLARRTLPAGTVTISAGIASAPEDGDNVDQLLGRADTRLFAAKQMGRDRVVGPDQHSGVRPSSAEFRAIVDPGPAA
ncbi:MAG TPA: diguanylate cyclase [Gemmatimonadales bacterium]|nr:diguanylate cyclase [Gemmatimonadales bacterium]